MMNREDFRENYCLMCGSQRCDSSDEMMNECWHFREENLQGLCRKCWHAHWCQEALRFLNMTGCSEFFQINTDVLKR